MNTRRVRRPSGAMIVALAALFVALSDSGTAATFQNFLLGKTNRPTRPTGIAASLRGPVFALANTGSGTAASFNVKSGTPPFAVNSTTKIQNLNADLLDGKDSTSFWSLTGNSGTNPAVNFLGTTDAQPLVVRTNGQEALRVNASGNVGIGTPGSTAKLAVEASGAADAVQVLAASGAGLTSVANAGTGVEGASLSGVGVTGDSSSNRGVRGTSKSDLGVEGITDSGAAGVLGTVGQFGCPQNLPVASAGVGGCGGPAGAGVVGVSIGGFGVYGNSNARAVIGILGTPSACPGPYAVGGCGQGLGIGVYGSSQSQGVVGTITGVGCPVTTAGVEACAGSSGDGLFAVINHSAGGSTAAAVHAINNAGGDIFLGEALGKRKARIDGSGTGYFDGGTQNSGADYADSMRADSAARLRPGDVLAIDPARGNTVSLARGANSTLVAGVYSTKPAVLGVGDHQLGGASLAGQVPVALVGIVPTRVSAENGPVRVGDLLTTSSTPGYAMKAKPVLVNGVAVYPTGTILGKAMQPLGSGRGLIKVLVTLR